MWGDQIKHTAAQPSSTKDQAGAKSHNTIVRYERPKTGNKPPAVLIRRQPTFRQRPHDVDDRKEDDSQNESVPMLMEE